MAKNREKISDQKEIRRRAGLRRELSEQLLQKQMESSRAYLEALYLEGSAADEILQETLIAIWRRYETLRSPEKLDPWARAILKNKVRKFFQLQQKEQQRCVTFSRLAAEDASTLEAIQNKLVYEEPERFQDSALYDMILKLRFPAGTILQLHYQYQETYSEIAQTLNMNPDTVRSIAFRSRKMLKEQILAGEMDESEACCRNKNA